MARKVSDYMSMLPDINGYNQSRKDYVKVQNIAGEVILFTKEEAKQALVTYISEELDLLATSVTIEQKIELQHKIDLKIKTIEKTMMDYLSTKFNEISEKIFEATLDFKIEQEVEKRLEEKIQKIRKIL